MTTANKLMIAFAIVMTGLTGFNTFMLYVNTKANNTAELDHYMLIKQQELIMIDVAQMKADK